jgi:DNA end-binding protein Ku
MEEKPTAKVINLMDALRQSLREKGGDEAEQKKPVRKAPVKSRTRKATPPKSDKPKRAPTRKAS